MYLFSECECSIAGTIAGMNICHIMTGTVTSLVLTVLIAFLFSECECSKAGIGWDEHLSHYDGNGDVTGFNCLIAFLFSECSVTLLE